MKIDVIVTKIVHKGYLIMYARKLLVFCILVSGLLVSINSQQIEYTIHQLRWQPDGNLVAFRDRDHIWILDDEFEVIQELSPVAYPEDLSQINIVDIPWGSTITVDKWLQHTQTNTSNQLWYRVKDVTIENVVYTFDSDKYDVGDAFPWSTVNPEDPLLSTLNEMKDIWINARMENFFYIVGLNDTNNLCEDIDEIGNDETLTFTYDREGTSQFAIAQGIQNSTLAIIQPPTYQRVTYRTNTNTPFANFPYNLVFGNQGATGSAVFISEVLWAGGLPMTGNFNNGEPFTTEGVCSWLVTETRTYITRIREGDPGRGENLQCQ